MLLLLLVGAVASCAGRLSNILRSFAFMAVFILPSFKPESVVGRAVHLCVRVSLSCVLIISRTWSSSSSPTHQRALEGVVYEYYRTHLFIDA